MDAGHTTGAYRFDRFTLDHGRGALLGPDGAEIPLRPKSLALLRLLVEHAGRAVDRDAIMAAVWPDVVVTDESITQCVRDIRKAIGDDAQQVLRTVPKRGYLLAAEATPVEATAPAPRAERRLAAILAADIVGYSRLVEQDESGTLAAIKGLREQAIDPLLAEHKGRIVKLMGDGAIVEFASVVDAVACAVAIQKAVADRQAKSPPTAGSCSASASTSATWWSRATTCSATGSTSRRGWSSCASPAGCWFPARPTTTCRVGSGCRWSSPASSRSRTSRGRYGPIGSGWMGTGAPVPRSAPRRRQRLAVTAAACCSL